MQKIRNLLQLIIKWFQWVSIPFHKTQIIQEETRDYVSPFKPPIITSDKPVTVPGSLQYYYDTYKQADLSGSLVSQNRVAWAVDKAFKGKTQYTKVEEATNVPWYLVAAIHCLESSFNWSTCLHNGQPWNRVTTLVPKGLGPWLSWEEAAIDALRRSKCSEISIWTLEECLKFAEAHNGLGYLRNHPDIKSPYLWSCTSLYTKGKYASDGKFDSQAISEQVGAAALFKILEKNNYIHLTYSYQGLIK